MVIIPGTTVGVISNKKGEFEIKMPPGTKSIEVSFAGFEKELLAVGTSNIIKVLLYTKKQKRTLPEKNEKEKGPIVRTEKESTNTRKAIFMLVNGIITIIMGKVAYLVAMAK